MTRSSSRSGSTTPPRRPSGRRAERRSVRAGLVAWIERPVRRVPAESDGVVQPRTIRRMLWIGGSLATGFVALTAQATSLMVLPDGQLEAKARIQFETAVEVEGRRGDILDRNGALLATTVELAAIHADPSKLAPDQVGPLAARLADILAADPKHLAARLSQHDRRDVLLGRGLTPAQVQVATELLREDSNLRSVLWTRHEDRRFYPGRAEAAPLLGVVGRSGTGLAGLEQTLDRDLRGATHKYVLWRDRKGRRITPEELEADPGNDVVLTVDRRIQHAAEEILTATLVRTGAEAAHAVVIDVETGDILAMVSQPTVNPNDTSHLDMSAFKNRAAMDAFEPGSVFKPLVMAAALEEGVVTPDTLVDCEGGAWAVGRKVIHDDHPHHEITATEVIKFSSNIGTAKLALMLGGERTVSYLNGFGIGRGIGLGIPGETSGVIRDPQTIKPIELATTAYGHGVSSSAVQLASAFATLANGGVHMKPRLVIEIRDRHGDVVSENPPGEDGRVVSEKSARQVMEMMVAVTEKGGTGTRAQVPGYLVGGKTGTAWKHVDGSYSSTARIGSFVGTLPADAPRVAIAVVVDTPTIGSRYGGIVAAPAFSQIGAATMRILGVPPDPARLGAPPERDDLALALADQADEEAPIEPAALMWMPDGHLRVPDLGGMSMRDALATLQGAGLSLAVTGSGRVTEQHPEPGQPILDDQPVALVLR